MFAALSAEVRQYLIVTGNYWGFTLTDGALRMLVVLHFHQLGYSPLEIALLFLFYEIFGVLTNLLGGWLGARLGLNHTMNTGLLLQVVALSMLLVPPVMLSVPWVMAAQALSGIAKDLNKMSAKSAIKLLLPEDARGQLFKWVAIVTGSKNALKGIGFFVGALLLATLGFRGAIAAMACALVLVWMCSMVVLKKDLGRAVKKPGFKALFSKSPAINQLSAARLFLFGARDIWFVVALPVYLSAQLNWDHWMVGGFLALWIIGYGLVQTLAPQLLRLKSRYSGQHAKHSDSAPDGLTALSWVAALASIPALIALGLTFGLAAQVILVGGLTLFGLLFAINSSLHSFLIVNYAARDGVSMDVGFYYMANAMGRLIGTVLSGWIFQAYGINACLYISSVFLLIATGLSIALPRTTTIGSKHQIGSGD